MKSISELLLVEPPEVKRVGYFVLFFMLIGTGLAIGKGSADALFLKRLGVEYFPYVYMMLSGVLAVSCMFYAAYVDRMSSERFFRIIFGIQFVLLFVLTVGIYNYQHDYIYYLYYIIYAVASELLLIHGALYIGQNFNTLQSKRLTPLIFAGFQVGMISGGLALVFIVPAIGLDNAPMVWAGLVALATIMLLARHRGGASPYYFSAARSSKSRLALALGEISEGFDYMRKSSLLRNASFALFFMVITYYMLSFSVHSVYTREFTEEEQLTSFFGWLVIVTNVAAMLMQLLISNRIIHHFGVRRSNYIYPATTLISFALLFISPTLYSALFASFNRESIMPAIRTPTRQLFFNILPDRMRGRARALSVAIVMPIALFVCGVLIILLKEYDGMEPVSFAGLVCAAIYLLFAYRMGHDYIVTLISSMREKLYLPGGHDVIYRDPGHEVLDMMKRGLKSDNSDVSLSYARALLEAYPQESLPMVLKRVRDLDMRTADQMLRLITLPGSVYLQELEELSKGADTHMQATILDIVLAVDEGGRDSKVRIALNSDNPRLRACAIHAVFTYQMHDLAGQAASAWQQLLSSCNNSHMATLRLMPLLRQLDAAHRDSCTAIYMSVIPQLLSLDDRGRRIAVLELLAGYQQLLPEQVALMVRELLGHEEPAIRSAATALIDRVSVGDERMQNLWRAFSDGHALVRDAALKVLYETSTNYVDRLYRMLLDNRDGTPRAQRMLLEQLIGQGASNVMLDEIVQIKLRYAASLRCALDTLGDQSDQQRELLAIALRERLEQVSDLVLMCIEPMISSSSIAVIRAALRTRDERHIADAIEALGSMDNHHLVELVSLLVKGDCHGVIARGIGRQFDDERDVLQWGSEAGDWWLKSCCLNILQANPEQQAHA